MPEQKQRKKIAAHLEVNAEVPALRLAGLGLVLRLNRVLGHGAARFHSKKNTNKVP
jgi:hypothetical protein